MALVQPVDFDTALMQVVLWQYNNAPNITGLIMAKQNWYEQYQDAFWSNWEANVFSLVSANDFGCIVWAIILGFPLGPFLNATPSYLSFGFNAYHLNFNNSNFAPATGGSANLTTAQKILVLRLRYYQITGRATKQYPNQVLAELFGEGVIYIVDNGNMTATVHYNNVLVPSNLITAIQNYDLIIRATAVTFTFTGFAPATVTTVWQAAYNKAANSGAYYYT
jgi:hypothetical protein